MAGPFRSLKSRCHGLPSIDEASLVAIQATLAMRPVMLPVHPANLSWLCTLEGSFAVQREF